MKEIFSSAKYPGRVGGPPSSIFSEYWGSFLGGKTADHSPPCSAEIKNEWSHTSAPPIRIHGTEMDNFISTSTFIVVTLMISLRQNLFEESLLVSNVKGTY